MHFPAGAAVNPGATGFGRLQTLAQKLDETLGSLDDLDERIAGLVKGGQQNFPSFLPLMYYRSMLRGEGRSDSWLNHRYPAIKPIRRNLLGHRKWLFGLLEGLIGLTTPTPAQHARRIVPLLASPDIEPHSGALFDKKARAILPSEGLTEAYMRRFMAASQALAGRTA